MPPPVPKSRRDYRCRPVAVSSPLRDQNQSPAHLDTPMNPHASSSSSQHVNDSFREVSQTDTDFGLCYKSTYTDDRCYNQAPGDDISLQNLKKKIEKRFGHSLESPEGDALMKVALYRQNGKILYELNSLKKQLSSSSQTAAVPSLANDLIDPKLFGLPLDSVNSFK